MGWRRTALYTVIAYLIAFVCEYSSVHNGFPKTFAISLLFAVISTLFNLYLMCQGVLLVGAGEDLHGTDYLLSGRAEAQSHEVV